MLKKILLTMLCLFLVSHTDGFAANKASDSTIKKNKAMQEYLPFEDKSDFDDASRGFMTTLDYNEIKTEKGVTVYDISTFDFVKGDAPDTVNPSLWRQSELVAKSGLYKVVDGIYQVRSFGVANATFIRGKTGWIVIDVLMAAETAAAALKLVQDEVEDLPVSAVIITHSHIDHFGGIDGILTKKARESGKIPVIAPKNFVFESVSENIMAGNPMRRRAVFMQGKSLEKSASGGVGSGLGTTPAVGGSSSMPRPTIEVGSNKEILMVDGIEMEFYYTPDAEAPAEFMFYIPKFRTLMQAEEMSKTMHNLYTLRGAKVRSGLVWSKYLQDTIERFGDDVEISIGSHHWPTWGNKNIVEFWKGQRDIYRYIHDETLRLANHGQTMLEIAENIKLPDSLAKQFSNRDYYGSISHNAKAQYQLYFGWFSGNPSELHELPPVEEGIKFVEYMGGSNAVIKKAQKDYDKGEYRWVATALNHVVFAEPNNKKAKALLADTLEQLGYQAETATWRNFYMTGAYELRNGTPKNPASPPKQPMAVLDIENYFDYTAMRLNHPKAADTLIQLNFILPDVNQKLGVVVENGVLNYTVGTLLKSPQATITLNRSIINATNFAPKLVAAAIKKGDIKVKGDSAKFSEFTGLLDTFKPVFNIVTP